MARLGTLRTWHDDRGFGFIAPADGGREVFVHISAFPRDGSRPTVGETLSFELASGKDGKVRAIEVTRQAFANSANPAARPAPASFPRRSGAPRSRQPKQAKKRSVLASLFGWLVIVLVGIAAVKYGHSAYEAWSKRRALQDMPPQPVVTDAPREPSAGVYRCDGRTHCSQMTSCEEAKFFLNNCPGTKMDGNQDGTPCEQQWCSGSF